MSKQLKKRYWVLVTQTGDFEINEEQKNYIAELISVDKNAMVELNDSIIAIRSVYSILTPDDYHNYTMKRSGGWKCKFDYWHNKNETCGHAYKKLGGTR